MISHHDLARSSIYITKHAQVQCTATTAGADTMKTTLSPDTTRSVRSVHYILVDKRESDTILKEVVCVPRVVEPVVKIVVRYRCAPGRPLEKRQDVVRDESLSATKGGLTFVIAGSK